MALGGCHTSKLSQIKRENEQSADTAGGIVDARKLRHASPGFQTGFHQFPINERYEPSPVRLPLALFLR
jgi:hypothetical protein